MKNIKFDLDDITLIPVEKSDISSRKECDIFNDQRKLPLMAAPMDTVVSKENCAKYIINNIIPCIPRGINQINGWSPHFLNRMDYMKLNNNLKTIE